ncbi:MAG: hypothetical protein EOO88_23070 [Pedobacter sp.]|nr:MAG: hypothetical protein EOO88_23070 [Pedobacter sp.]
MEHSYNSLRPRPPYWVGFLCLIPLLGFIAGVFILMTGIFRYKDRRVIFLGVFGIVFTTAIYSLLFYQLKYGKLGRDGFAAISKIQMRTLVQKIEYFNLTNGRYPENLEELKKTDELAPIADPLQSRGKKGSDNFNYSMVKDGYTLFSSGVDGKAQTVDDFYPDIQMDSSSKLGLVLP